MRFLAVIPARSGSKGVPKKNIKLLGGKPLIHYTIEAAMEVFEESDICVSSDGQDIIDVAAQTGLNIPFKRPRDLARDNSGSHEVLLHALEYYERNGHSYDAIVMLQPTSPLRTSRHILEALDLFSLDVDMVVSVTETKSNPYYVLYEENNKGYLNKSKKGNYLRRQDCPKVWEFNGAVYVINVNSIRENWIGGYSKIIKYVMDEFSSIDIDTEFDFTFAEHCFKQEI